jgi:hypothetical protein
MANPRNPLERGALSGDLARKRLTPDGRLEQGQRHVLCLAIDEAIDQFKR